MDDLSKASKILNEWAKTNLSERYSLFSITTCECGKQSNIFPLYASDRGVSRTYTSYLIHKSEDGKYHCYGFYIQATIDEGYLKAHLARFSLFLQKGVARKLDREGGSLGRPEEDNDIWNKLIDGVES